MQGRKSIYENENSLISEQKIEKLVDKISSITLEELDNFQMKHGISNKYLSILTGHSTTQISDIKTGKTPMPKRIQQHLFLIMERFERE